MANPAAAGIYDFADLTIAGRWQWLGVQDAPRTSYFGFSVPLSFKPKYYNPGIRTSKGPIENPKISTGQTKHVVGGQVIADQYGAFRKLSFLATYALHIPINKSFNLSFGLKGGLSNNAFLADKAQVLNLVDPSQAYTDNTYTNFVANQSNKFIMDLSAGFYFYGKGFYLGISSHQLTKNFVEFGQGTANFNPQMHYNIITGYKININENFTLTPNLMVKYMFPAPPSIDFVTQAEYKEWLWFGLGYRHTDAILGMFGLNISNRFKLGYSFDFSISKFKSYSSGGHELVLGLMLGR
jgi:type IX secretion system PorP/SprF family membrane protein